MWCVVSCRYVRRYGGIQLVLTSLQLKIERLCHPLNLSGVVWLPNPNPVKVFKDKDCDVDIPTGDIREMLLSTVQEAVGVQIENKHAWITNKTIYLCGQRKVFTNRNQHQTQSSFEVQRIEL